MKKLIKAGLCLALACGVVACEKPMEKKKEEKRANTSKKHVVSQQMEQIDQNEAQ